LRSPDTVALHRAAFRPLLAKEVAEMLSGRALWTMLLILCPLAGFSFFQAVSLYGEASAAARDQPVLSSGLSPLDGVLVPSFGAFYVAVTLLFPFVAIRALGREKETAALHLLVQLPYRVPTLIGAKMTAIAAAWFIALIPALSAVAIWALMGGHLSAPETLNLLLGQLLYGLLVGAIALFAAAISESAATAAIITLAFTIGSWVLDFALAGQPGALQWIAALSLTQILHTFEQGLRSAALPRSPPYGCIQARRCAPGSSVPPSAWRSLLPRSPRPRRSGCRPISPRTGATRFPPPTSAHSPRCARRCS
jgi:ABC-2 type transport system permease protein